MIGFSSGQMEQIRLGLEEGIDVTSDILEEVQRNAKELWSGKELGEQKEWKIPAHGVLLLAW